MLTPPEAGGSPIVGARDGPGFKAVNGATTGDDSIPRSSVSKEQQPHKIVEGVWERLAAREGSGSQQALAAWPAASAGAHPLTDDSMAVQQQIVQASQAHVDKQISVEFAKLVASFRTDDAASENIPQQNTSTPYRGLDYDSLQALRSLIYNEECSVQWDEETLLNRIEKIWRESVRADYDKMVENIPVFIARERAILTWVELRRHLAALDRADRSKCSNLSLQSPYESCVSRGHLNTDRSLGWNSEGQSAPEIERRIQQHRTLMGATQTIMANFEDIGHGFGLGYGLVIDRDELLRQAFVVLAGEKFAVEMPWNPIEFTRIVSWLGESVEPFRKSEEEEGRSTLWYVG
jgi:hypothetical protein